MQIPSKWSAKMVKQETKEYVTLKNVRKNNFDPFRLISDKEFCNNLDTIISYYKVTKGETKQRFTGSERLHEDFAA